MHPIFPHRRRHKRKGKKDQQRQEACTTSIDSCSPHVREEWGGDDDHDCGIQKGHHHSIMTSKEDASQGRTRHLHFISWLDPILWIVVIGVLGVYSQTLYPSVAGGDSGELLAESCHLGVSHPPGYPLFNILNYFVVHYLPGEQTKAWKANFFSAGTTIITLR